MEYIKNGKVKNIKTLPKIILFALFGSLWSFSHVGYSFGLLPWFTFIPFIYSIKYEDYKSGFFYSWIFGFFVYLFHFWWMPKPIAFAMILDFLPPYLYFFGWIIGWLATLLICAYHGLVYSLFFLISKYIAKNRHRLFYLCIPFVGTVMDVFFPKLWHDQIGYTQYVFFHFSQIADTLGVPFLTFIILACNSVAVVVIEAILFKRKVALAVGLFSVTIFVIVGISVYGILRVKQIEKLSNIAPKARIGVVQGNFSGLDKKNENKYEEMIIKYNSLSEKLLGQNPDLIVWPETAIPLLYEIPINKYEKIKRFDAIPLLTGLHLFDIDGKNGNYHIYNSLVLVSGDKIKEDYYQKIKLLPFVERFPLSFLNVILNFFGYQEFSAGKEYKIMQTRNIKFSPNICYEAILPDLIRKALVVGNKKANLIINATNDSWYGRTIEPRMHLQMSGFRSIENRRTLVRATCTGYSAVFEPTGDKTYESPLFKEDAVVKEIPLLEIDTIYSKWGWFFPWVLLIALFVALCISLYRKAKYKDIKARLIKKRIHKRNIERMWQG